MDVMPNWSRFSLPNTEMAIGTVWTSCDRFSAVTTTTSMSAKAGAVKAVERSNAPTSVTDLAVQEDKYAIFGNPPLRTRWPGESRKPSLPHPFLVRPELVGQIDAVIYHRSFEV